MNAQIIAVIGATGTQGSGTVSALLNRTDFAVRAVSRNPDGPKAQALVAQHKEKARIGRMSLVKCDAHHPNQLVEALQGVYGVFVALPHLRIGQAQANNVQHFLYSSIQSVAHLSEGWYRHVTDAESKAVVSEYATSQLANVTLLYPGMFYSNLEWPAFAQREGNGSVRICFPLRPDAPMHCVDDRYDVGNFAAAVFTADPARMRNKIYLVDGSVTTPGEPAAQYHTFTGEQARFDPLSLEEAVQLMVRDERDAQSRQENSEMFQFINEGSGHQASFSAGVEHAPSFEDLGVRASDLQMFLARTGFRVGQKA